MTEKIELTNEQKKRAADALQVGLINRYNGEPYENLVIDMIDAINQPDLFTEIGKLVLEGGDLRKEKELTLDDEVEVIPSYRARAILRYLSNLPAEELRAGLDAWAATHP